MKNTKIYVNKTKEQNKVIKLKHHEKHGLGQFVPGEFK